MKHQWTYIFFLGGGKVHLEFMLIMLNGSQSSFRDNRCWTSFVDFQGDNLADFARSKLEDFSFSDGLGLIGVKVDTVHDTSEAKWLRTPKVIKNWCYVYAMGYALQVNWCFSQGSFIGSLWVFLGDAVVWNSSHKGPVGSRVLNSIYRQTTTPPMAYPMVVGNPFGSSKRPFFV